jgi:hypothetical protein
MAGALMRLPAAELRVIGEANGVDVHGLTKAQIVEQLVLIEAEEGPEDGAPDSALDSDNDDDVSNEDYGERDTDLIHPDDYPDLTPEIRALKLQLSLERERLEVDRQKLEVERQRSLLRDISAPVDNARTGPGDIKSLLPSMQSDDVVSYFNAVERVLQLNDVDESLWAKLLVPHLSVKAMKIYSRLSLEQCRNYCTVKETILQAFKCSSQQSLDKFRNAFRSGQESYALFSNRLKDLLTNYLESKRIVDFDSLCDDMIFTQFMQSLDRVPDVKRFVLERNPTNVVEACKCADLYYDVKNKTANYGSDTQQQIRQSVSGPRNFAGAQSFGRGNEQRQAGRFQRSGPQGPSQRPDFRTDICHVCGGAHATVNHRPRYGANKQTNRVDNNERNCSDYIIPTFINHIRVKAIRDTGSDVSIVGEHLVMTGDYTDEFITLCPAFGDSYKARVATVLFKSPKFGTDATVRIRVAVVPNIRQVLIGNDLFRNYKQFKDCVQIVRNHYLNLGCTVNSRHTAEPNLSLTPHDSKGVITAVTHDMNHSSIAMRTERAQAVDIVRQMTRSAAATEPIQPSIALTNTVQEVNAITSDEAGCLAVTTRSQSTSVPEIMTESEPTSTVDEFSRLSTIDNSEHTEPDSIHHSQFISAQLQDETLTHWRQLHRNGDARFVKIDGILYKYPDAGITDARSRLLVLPEQYRIEAIRTAHDSYTGGHFGSRKTINRLSKVYAFPGLHKQVKEHIRTCHTCQLVSTKRVTDRVPLNPIVISGQPFDEIVIDVLGKIPNKSSAGHQYILVIVDHATRFVVFEPLRNLNVS